MTHVVLIGNGPRLELQDGKRLRQKKKMNASYE
jgi:hypothetical protein